MASRRPSSYDSFPAGESSRRNSSSRRDASAYSRSTYPHGNDMPRYTPEPMYSYDSPMRDDYVRERARKNRKKKRILTGVIAAILVLVLGAGAALAAYVGVLNGKLSDGIGDDLKGVLSGSAKPTDPFYVLLMGVDKSEDRVAEYGDSFRSDSMILARVDPKQKQMTLVSIVRDTYVNIDGYGPNKINAAHALGGPALTVKTVSEFAGVPISHYAEIDFDGFKAAVDALGGIEVDVPIEIDDEDAGGHVSAGRQVLNGDEALILCRARHAYDEIGAGDFYRAANQRMVMGAIADKLLESDPATIASTVASLCDYIETDMKVTDIVNVAVSMQGMDTSTGIYSTMNPTISSYENGVWYEYSNNEAWQAMMKRIDAGEPPTADAADSANDGGVTDGSIDPEYIAQSVLSGGDAEAAEAKIEVRNGSGVSGVAAKASSKLTNSGYDVTTVGDAQSYDYTKTLVVYDSDGDAKTAKEIAKSLGVGEPVENDGSYSIDGSYLVVVGGDYR